MSLLAEATGARPGNAQLGCYGTYGDAISEKGGSFVEVTWLNFGCRPGEPGSIWSRHEPCFEWLPGVAEVGAALLHVDFNPRAVLRL